MDIKSINMYTWDNILRDRSRIAASHAYCNTHYLDEVEREREMPPDGFIVIVCINDFIFLDTRTRMMSVDESNPTIRRGLLSATLCAVIGQA
jgi:hypothetical protein